MKKLQIASFIALFLIAAWYIFFTISLLAEISYSFSVCFSQGCSLNAKTLVWLPILSIILLVYLVLSLIFWASERKSSRLSLMSYCLNISAFVVLALQIAVGGFWKESGTLIKIFSSYIADEIVLVLIIISLVLFVKGWKKSGYERGER